LTDSYQRFGVDWCLFLQGQELRFPQTLVNIFLLTRCNNLENLNLHDYLINVGFYGILSVQMTIRKSFNFQQYS